MFKKFRAKARKLAENSSGIAVALSYGDAIIDAATFGRDPQGRPLKDTARFRLASISKTLTALAVMRLVELGSFSLDDTIGELWKGKLRVSDKRVRDITVRQLMQHLSGIGVHSTVFFDNGATDWREAARMMLRSRLAKAPGTHFEYSNGNYVVLGMLIEQYTGKKIERATKDLVLSRLGISTATFSGTSVTDQRGPAYVVTADRYYLEALGPAGAWTMSASDVARVYGALQIDNAESPISLPTREAMRTPGKPTDGKVDPDEDYGFALERFKSLWGHTGTVEDVRNMAVMASNGYSVALLCACNVGRRSAQLLDWLAAELVALQKLPAH